VVDVLKVVRRLGLDEAEVDCDGQYSFSVRLYEGLWCIFQRDQHGESDAKGVLG
jgi:hypothetical protein